MQRKRRIRLLAAWFVAALAVLAIAPHRPAAAEPLAEPTPFLTPTPNEQGSIVYIVQEGDTMWRVAAIAEITVEELMALNGIQAGDFISPGMELIIGSVPATLTPAPTVTPTIEVEPLVGTGEICIMLFIDANGNARLEEGEVPLPNGQVSVADREGRLAGEHTTDDNAEGHCFLELEPGDYNVSAAVPADHNPTTSMNVPVRLNAGDVQFVQFGGQPSAISAPAPASGTGRSTLMGALGLLLLASSGVLAYMAMRSGRGT